MSDSWEQLLADLPPLPAELHARWVALQARHEALETEFAATLEQEKLASLKELAYGASHELNNPLANIATRAQVLLSEETHPEKKRKLLTIIAQAMRAHEMISDLMLFAKPPAVHWELVDVTALVPEIVAQFHAAPYGQPCNVSWETNAPHITTSADKTQLAVVLHALLRNAAEAALPQEATITLEIEEQSTGTHIFVRDHGPGISPAVRKHLFDPFFSGREAGRGLGFGLAKCWRIMQLHGGTITLDAVAEGSCFHLWLPDNRHNLSS